MNKQVLNDLKLALQKSYIILMLFVTGIVIGYEYHYSFLANPGIKEWQIEKFQQTLINKEKEAISVLKDFHKLGGNNSADEVKDWILNIQSEYEKKGFSFYLYVNDTIHYWSTNSSEIPFRYSGTFKREAMSIELGNAIYYTLSDQIGLLGLVCLMNIRNKYSIQNNLLKNGYQDGFKMNDETILNINHCLNCEGIYNSGGNRVFSIEFEPYQETDLKNYRQVYLYIVTGILFLFLLFILVFTRNIKNFRLKNRITLGWVFLLLLLRIFFLFRIKELFYDIEIFSPALFAASDLLSSLGDLLLHAILFFVLAILIYENFTFKQTANVAKMKFNIIVRFILRIGLVFILTFWFQNIFKSLILNSNISFEIYKVLNISKYTVLALLGISIIFIGICILLDKFLLIYMGGLTKKDLNKFALLSVLTFGIANTLLFGFAQSLVLSAIFISMFYIRLTSNGGYNLSKVTLLVFLFSVFSVYIILNELEKKQLENKKVLAVNLASEHDFIAEILLENVSNKMKTDKKIYNFFEDEESSLEDLRSYITSKYFSGYLGKYKIQVLICTAVDSIFITPDNLNYHCYSFFDNYVKEFGLSVPGTAFYFMNNEDGRIGYFGNIVYNDLISGEYSLFIELQSKLISNELGYPELLLGKDQQKTSTLKDYAYAKYNNQVLIAQSGNFQYPLRNSFDTITEFYSHNQDNFKHLVYASDNENVIVISNPELRSSNVLFTFSYLFLFYIISIGIMMLLYKLNMIRKLFLPTFRNKIQFSMILVLIISLVLIGGFTIYYSTKQYKSKHFEFISEKLQSVQIELEQKLGGYELLTRNWNMSGYDNLDELLRKLSNVFFCDIHLYDPYGDLLASSRPEIFTKKLQGSKINSEAFLQLTQNNRSEYIHNEDIGNLNYLSGYLPFFNHNGELLAYLNLPYFTKQKVFSGEITSLVIAVLNIYVLLFLLTVALAFIMSEQITRPLKFIQDSFKSVKLGIHNEIINYSGDDEIAKLIKEYNRMVLEITENAEKLARSEREMAWREMARQIAHEIKNPLTPMKLQIQQLQRAWNDKAGNWDALLNRVSATLIEQINTLSSIATEFSNFAKMPQPKNEVVNVIEKLKNIVSLFEHTENVRFYTHFNGRDEVNIYADKEQVLRVFTNLVKNAIQAIPEGKKGKIDIKVTANKEDSLVKIEICDNGKGIPKEIHKNLFQPNFTTKSGGMGLGLAIVKKIVDSTNGHIYFSSELDKGTCFIIDWEQFR